MHGNGRQRVTAEPLVMKCLGLKEAGMGEGVLVPVSINVWMIPIPSDGPLAQFFIPRS
jgi:hypothetical protein